MNQTSRRMEIPAVKGHVEFVQSVSKGQRLVALIQPIRENTRGGKGARKKFFGLTSKILFTL